METIMGRNTAVYPSKDSVIHGMISTTTLSQTININLSQISKQPPGFQSLEAVFDFLMFFSFMIKT